jgi:hypothetical protein
MERSGSRLAFIFVQQIAIFPRSAWGGSYCRWCQNSDFSTFDDSSAVLAFINRVFKEHYRRGAMSVADWKVDFNTKNWPREKWGEKHKSATPKILSCNDYGLSGTATGSPYGEHYWIDIMCQWLKLDLTIRSRDWPKKQKN